MSNLKEYAVCDEYTAPCNWWDIHDDGYNSLEEVRINLGHSPCYARRGYTYKYGINVPDIGLLTLEQFEELSEMVVDLAEIYEGGMPEFKTEINNLLEDYSNER